MRKASLLLEGLLCAAESDAPSADRWALETKYYTADVQVWVGRTPRRPSRIWSCWRPASTRIDLTHPERAPRPGSPARRCGPGFRRGERCRPRVQRTGGAPPRTPENRCRRRPGPRRAASSAPRGPDTSRAAGRPQAGSFDKITAWAKASPLLDSVETKLVFPLKAAGAHSAHADATLPWRCHRGKAAAAAPKDGANMAL